MRLAEIPYPRIDPEILRIGPVHVRWYGLTYVLAFGLAFLVLRNLAKRDRWPVRPDRVADVLFWGILGVFVGGRLGWILFYGIPMGDVHNVWQVFLVWEGGMSFHGGLLGVIVAYWIYTWKTGKPRGAFFDGLTLATPLGIICVRLGNFINGELYGRPWSGPWSMRFPNYGAFKSISAWEAARASGHSAVALWTDLRHPSQIYEALGEGVLLFFFLRWLMLKKGVGGGRIAGSFLVGYGAIRFVLEFFRQPDQGLGFAFLGIFTRGQQLCLGMILAGIVVFAVCAVKSRRHASEGAAAS